MELELPDLVSQYSRVLVCYRLELACVWEVLEWGRERGALQSLQPPESDTGYQLQFITEPPSIRYWNKLNKVRPKLGIRLSRDGGALIPTSFCLRSVVSKSRGVSLAV